MAKNEEVGDEVKSDVQKLKDSIDAFFDKKDVDVRDRYHIVYDLSLEYHDEIMSEDDTEDADVSEEDEVDGPGEEEDVPAEEEDEVDVPEEEDLEVPLPPEEEEAPVPKRVPPLNLQKKSVQGHEQSMKSKLQSMPVKQPAKGNRPAAPLVKRPMVRVRE